MGKPIEIKVDGDTSGVERSVDSATDSLDKFGTFVENVGDDAKATGRKIEDAFDQAGDEVKDTAKKIDRDLTKALDDVEKKARGAGDKTSRSLKKSFDDAGEGAEEFRDEANSTAKESAASFDGTADSITDAFQEIAANAFAGFGPAGAAAGLAIALGIGVGTAALQQSAEEAAATKERIIDLADKVREADGDITALDWGQVFRDFGNEIADPKSWFEPWQKASRTNFELLIEDAKRAGVEYADLFQGMAGDQDAATRSLDTLNEKLGAERRALDEAMDAAGRGEEVRGRSANAIASEVEFLEKLTSRLQESSGLTDEALEYERLMREAYEDSAAGIAEKNEALREQQELTRDAISSELDYLDAIEDQTAKLKENAEGGFDKNTAAGRENLRALGEIADAANEYADSLADVDGDQVRANETIAAGRDRLIEAAEQLGMSREEAERYADSLGLIPREVATTARAETGEAERKLNDAARHRYVPMRGNFDNADAERQINKTTSKTFYVEVTPRVGNMRGV
ncbi:hypothetical protein [Cellulomonas oligotrophica]|uniref:ElaB/YqjD/DUF883 family membrane-anchored ribosome-binding protein n=1 Tax=Cellulomonas oligotrophica TaxID=931536 RepID=A0A7Y9FI63_9CELL|nr:hypothetical protein [Cellulomonas oligotrophica]NYD87775.1 ElaB/YqjD/DUF883 family membrane-anchored ribosome-binding protein [Cellulomonas oligotrophica]GIG33021.1 hypothetical protein Col01nite_21800 [Cellulomonas oligotrophica]